MDDNGYWDRIANKYDNLYENPWSRYEDHLTSGILRRELRLAPGKKILDIGCGNGLGFRLIGSEKSDAQYTGIDISQKMIEDLKRRHPSVDAVEGDANSALNLLPPEEFDFIFSINTAASFPSNTKTFVHNISRALKADGRYSLSFLNRNSLRRHLAGLKGGVESYKTRGDRSPGVGVLANTMTEPDFAELISGTGLLCEAVDHQSVLGGVWESRLSLMVERLTFGLLHSFAHSVIFSGSKGLKTQ